MQLLINMNVRINQERRRKWEDVLRKKKGKRKRGKSLWRGKVTEEWQQTTVVEETFWASFTSLTMLFCLIFYDVLSNFITDAYKHGFDGSISLCVCVCVGGLQGPCGTFLCGRQCYQFHIYVDFCCWELKSLLAHSRRIMGSQTTKHQSVCGKNPLIHILRQESQAQHE